MKGKVWICLQKITRFELFNPLFQSTLQLSEIVAFLVAPEETEH